VLPTAAGEGGEQQTVEGVAISVRGPPGIANAGHAGLGQGPVRATVWLGMGEIIETQPTTSDSDRVPLDGHVGTTVRERIGLHKDGKFQVQPPHLPTGGQRWWRATRAFCACSHVCSRRHVKSDTSRYGRDPFVMAAQSKRHVPLAYRRNRWYAPLSTQRQTSSIVSPGHGPHSPASVRRIPGQPATVAEWGKRKSCARKEEVGAGREELVRVARSLDALMPSSPFQLSLSLHPPFASLPLSATRAMTERGRGCALFSAITFP